MVAGAVILLSSAGCYRPPQVASDNLKLISSLRTALSTRNLERLDDNQKALDDRRAEGKLSEEEFAAFSDLIAMARAGKWEKAEQRVVKFQRVQQPTQEQIDRLPKAKKRE